MKDAPYIRINTGDTFCPECENNVILLMPERPQDVHDHPSFYVCRYCLTIGQVGVGIVPKIRGRVNLDDRTRETGIAGGTVEDDTSRP